MRLHRFDACEFTRWRLPRFARHPETNRIGGITFGTGRTSYWLVWR